MLKLMQKWEQHKKNKWVRSPYVSAYAYAYVGGVLTCYAYALVRTSLYKWKISFRSEWTQKFPPALKSIEHLPWT